VRITHLSWCKLVLPIVLFLGSASLAAAAEPELTKDQIKDFMLKAKVVSSKHTSKGITDPYRLTLSDGTITHEAVFQAVDEHKATMKFDDGHVEINFIDSYKYNVAAYAISELVGMDDMIPVHVERKWNGMVGSLSWLVPVTMDEADRQKRHVSAPDSDAWNKQMYKIRVFDELVYDTDPNLTNVLVGENWKIWRVDFSRAFRLSKDIRDPKNLVKIDKQLLERLKELKEPDVTLKTKGLLTKPEVQAVMARRDKIVSLFDNLIKQKGEGEVLY